MKSEDLLVSQGVEGEDGITKIVYVIGVFAIFIIAILSIAYIGYELTQPPQSAIDVFSTRFDECMATERFTRDECMIYAKGE
jgi:hypothetical protein